MEAPRAGQLRADEIAVLRSVIAEWRLEQERKRVYAGAWKRGHLVAVSFMGVSMFALQVISIYLAARGHMQTVIVRRP